MVEVTVLGEEKKEVPFQKGMSVEQAVKAAGLSMPENPTVTIDGKKAEPSTEIERKDAKIVVSPKVAMG